MRRALQAAVLALALSAGLTVAAPAGGANECDGLQVCVSVVGPWVVVPGAGGTARANVAYQLSCPRNHIVAGLDAELSIRDLEVMFLGRLGSPVNPGITTRREVTFLGTNVGRSASSASFKPYIGCMTSAGGGPRVPTAAGAFPPGEPTTRRVTTTRVHPGTSTVSVRCRRGERLVGSSHAFGFRTPNPPSANLAASVSGTRVVRGGRVLVRVRGDAELDEVPAVVQVHALCAGSR